MDAEPIVRMVLWLALGACSYADLRERRIPDSVVFAGLAVSAAARLAAGVLFEPQGLDAMAAGAAGFLLLALVHGASRGRLGLGDAKLSALIGFALGLEGWVVAMLAATAAALLAGGVLVASGRLRPRDPVPFAPALAAGAMFSQLLGARSFEALWGP